MNGPAILHAIRLDGMKLPSANALTRSRWAESNWRARFEHALVPLPVSKRLSCIVDRFVRQNGHMALRRIAKPIPGAPHCILYVTRVMGRGERLYDQRNLDAGVKPLEDALVLAGMLPADSPEWLTVMPTTQRRAENGERAPAVVVRIERRG